MDKCPHFPDDAPAITGCTFCSGKETTRVTPKPIKVAKRSTAVRRDPGLVMAARVARGEVCEHCRTETAPIGCLCSRQGHYHDQLGAGGLVRGWTHDHVDDFMPAGSTDAARAIRHAERFATGLVFSTMARATRRAGITGDDITDPGGKLPGCSAAAAQRLEVLDEFHVEPRWHAPRCQEADLLPI